MNRRDHPWVGAHVVDRFVERFPADAHGKNQGEIIDAILAAWDAGLPWGAHVGPGETRLATLPSGAQCVMPAKCKERFDTPTMATILTLEQAMTNQQQMFGRASGPNPFMRGKGAGRRRARRRTSR